MGMAVQWHEPREMGTLEDPFDRESMLTPSSEVWDGYGELDQGSETEEERDEESSQTMTTEQEFLSYAMKLPQPQFGGIDLMNCRDGRHLDGSKEVRAVTSRACVRVCRCMCCCLVWGKQRLKVFIRCDRIAMKRAFIMRRSYALNPVTMLLGSLDYWRHRCRMYRLYRQSNLRS